MTPADTSHILPPGTVVQMWTSVIPSIATTQRSNSAPSGSLKTQIQSPASTSEPRTPITDHITTAQSSYKMPQTSSHSRIPQQYGPDDLKTHVTNLSIRKIRSLLKSRDIPATGSKSELIGRLCMNWQTR